MSLFRYALLSNIVKESIIPFNSSVFDMEIDLTKTDSNTFIFPLDTNINIITSWATSGKSLTINWGDGNNTVINGIYTQNTLTHTYETKSLYKVSIHSDTGVIPNICCGRYNSLKSNESIVSILSPLITFIQPTLIGNEDTGYGGAIHLFDGCTNLKTIPYELFYRNPSIDNMAFTFYECESLQLVHSLLFYFTPNVTSFNWTFAKCSGLQQLNDPIFKYNTLVKSFVGTFNTASITTITDAIFETNTLVEDFSNCFSFAKMTTLSKNLFKYNTLVKSFVGTFYNCSELTTIEDNIFDENVNVESFDSCFAYCDKLLTVPELLFVNNLLVLSFRDAFNNCSVLQLNKNIFCDETIGMSTRFANKDVDLFQCFKVDNVNSVQGIAPQLWNYTFKSVNSGNCFKGQSTSSLNNYNDIPNDWK